MPHSCRFSYDAQAHSQEIRVPRSTRVLVLDLPSDDDGGAEQESPDEHQEG